MDSYAQEQIRTLERQVAYLIEKACRYGHDWTDWRRMGHPDRLDLYFEDRSCRACGKGERSGPFKLEVASQRNKANETNRGA